MSWHTGTSTDYLDLLQELIDMMTNSSVSSVAVNSGGSGYAVGDIATINGGTTVGGKTAAVEVLEESFGVVTSLRIARGGSYTVNPGTGATTTAETGTGTGLTVNTTIGGNGWSVVRRSQEAVSAVIADGGTGYTNGDLLTVDMTGGGILGASDLGVAPVFQVTGESGGVITSVSLVTAGNLEEVPDVDGVTGGDQANVSGGTGSGAVLTVTYQDAATQDQIVVLEGSPPGVSNLYLAIKTYQTTDVTGFLTCYNWAIFGLASFNPGLEFKDQVGRSPGVNATTGSIDSATSNGAWVALKDADAFDMTYWISVTSRRVTLIAKTEDASFSNYQSLHMGYLNPFGTPTEMPYPIFVMGSTSRWNSRYVDQTIGRCTSPVHAYGITTMSTAGPGFVRSSVNNLWEPVRNSSITGDTTSPSRTASSSHIIYPCGTSTKNPPDTEDDLIVNSSIVLDWPDMIPQTGVPGIVSEQLEATPFSGGDDLRILVPATCISTDENGTGTEDDIYEINGELDELYWLPGVGVSDEDTFLIGTNRYRIFPNGNQRQVFSYWAVREA